MATSTDLAAYIAQVRYRYIDVDGVFGAQCWDQWSHYATNFLGVPSWPTYTNAGNTWPHAGLACNVYHNARAAGLEQWFEILPASATPRAGDVAFWEYGSAWYPDSHVATVLDALSNGMLRCLTQNPTAVAIVDLIKNGILGYLRPKALRVGAVDTSKTPNLSQEEKWEASMYRYPWETKRSTLQKIQPNRPTRVILNNDGKVTAVKGPGDVIGASSSVRLKAKPGARLEVWLVVENDKDQLIEELGFDRQIFDEFGLASANVAGSVKLARGHLIRTIVHTSEGAGVATVERHIGNCYARSGA